MSNRHNMPQSQYIAPTTIWNRVFFGVFFANMTFNFAMMMCNTLISVYADALGCTARQVGVLSSIYALTALAFRFVAGPSLIAFNRKLILTGSCLFMATAYIGFSISGSFVWLLVFRLVQGIGNAFGNVCCLAMVSDTLPKEKMNAGLGYYACAQIIAQAIGPAAGLQMVEWMGYRVTYWIGALLMLSAILLISFVKLPPMQYQKFSLDLRNSLAKEAALPALVTFFITTSFMTINSFLAVYAEKIDVSGIGLYFTVYAIAVVATRPLVGNLMDRFGFSKIGAIAAVFAALTMLFIGFSHALWMFLGAAVVASLGFGAIQPALQTLCIKTVSNERRGAASATYFIAFDLATLIGPTVAGTVADDLGYGAIWPAMTLPVLVGLALVIVFKKQITEQETAFSGRSQSVLPKE